MSVEKIMSASIVSVKMDDSLGVIKRIFEKTSFHHLLVVEDEKLFGVLSDRDYFKALSPNIGTPAETPKDLATLNKKAHQILTRQPITLPPTASIYEAVKIFNHHNLSCIPIVDAAGRPIGIISWRDILKAIEKTAK